MSGSKSQVRVHGTRSAGDMAQAYHRALRNMADVVGVSLLDEGRVQILARSGRNPRILARDVKTVLLTTLGESVEDGSIDVVQIGGEDWQGGRDSRIRLDSIQTSRDMNGVVATVSLKLGDRIVLGQSAGGGGSREEVEALAQATVQAMQGLLGEAVQIHLVACEELNIAGHRAEVVVVEWLTVGDSNLLIGSSLVRRSRGETAVKAVLDALNRFVRWSPA